MTIPNRQDATPTQAGRKSNFSVACPLASSGGQPDLQRGRACNVEEADRYWFGGDCEVSAGEDLVSRIKVLFGSSHSPWAPDRSACISRTPAKSEVRLPVARASLRNWSSPEAIRPPELSLAGWWSSCCRRGRPPHRPSAIGGHNQCPRRVAKQGHNCQRRAHSRIAEIIRIEYPDVGTTDAGCRQLWVHR